MRNWIRSIRQAFQPASKLRLRVFSRPTMERLEDRTVLQNGLTPNQCFVNQVYQDLLHRQADAAGLNGFSSVLDQNQATRLQVVQTIQGSLEFRTTVIQNLYTQFLHRPADQAGLNTFVNFLAQGGTELQAEAIILGSPEYFQTRGGGTNAGFLQAIYQDVLGRTIDATGQQSFTQALNNGLSRTQAAMILLNSPEGITAEVQNLFSTFLHRPADQAGLTAFTTALENQSSMTGASQGLTSALLAESSAQTSLTSNNNGSNAGSASVQTGANGSNAVTTNGSSSSGVSATGSNSASVHSNGSNSTTTTQSNNNGSNQTTTTQSNSNGSSATVTNSTPTTTTTQTGQSAVQLSAQSTPGQTSTLAMTPDQAAAAIIASQEYFARCTQMG